nr:MAG TPA: hypothetical protein [Bacteriophage sp.]
MSQRVVTNYSTVSVPTPSLLASIPQGWWG